MFGTRVVAGSHYGDTSLDLWVCTAPAYFKAELNVQNNGENNVSGKTKTKSKKGESETCRY